MIVSPLRTARFIGMNWLGFSAFSAMAAVPLGLLYGLDATAPVLLAACTAAFPGGMLVMLARRENRDRLRAPEASIAVIAGWVTIPAFAAIATFNTASSATFLHAYTEAVGAFTTTGPLMGRTGAEEAGFAMVWHALLGWAGGLATLLTASLLTLQIDRQSVTRSIPAFAAPDPSLSVRRVRPIFGAVALLYIGITFAAGLVSLAGKDLLPAERLVQTLSLPATAGFAAVPSEEWVRGLHALITLIAALNLWVIWRVVSGRPRRLAQDYEARVFVVAVIAVSGLAMLTGPVDLFSGFYEAVNIMATAGGPIAQEDGFILPPGAVILLLLAGGCSISTSGGLKWARVLRIVSGIRREVDAAISVHAVQPDKSAFAPRARVPLAAPIAFATGVVTLSSLILSAALDGAYEGVAAAIALHSNAGPAFAALTGPDAVTDLMTSPIFAVTACAAMIFGRLETAAALPMIGFLINRLRG